MLKVEVLMSGSGGNAITVQGLERKLLLDCGFLVTNFLRTGVISLGRVSAALLTHEHLDHSKGVTGILKLGIPVYTSQGTMDALAQKIGMDVYRCDVVEAMQPFRVEEWEITAFDVFHDAARPFGFYATSEAGKVLYVTDTGKLPYTFSGVTHAIIEANYDVSLLAQSYDSTEAIRVAATHLSIETVIDFFKRNDNSKLQEVYLVHLSDKNSNAEDFKRRVQEVVGVPVYVAKDKGGVI